jgi:hypothetical protein
MSDDGHVNFTVIFIIIYTYVLNHNAAYLEHIKYLCNKYCKIINKQAKGESELPYNPPKTSNNSTDSLEYTWLNKIISQ